MGNNSKVIRVEVETEDGSIIILSGDEANRYMETVKKSLFITGDYGVLEKELHWFKTNKYPAPIK